MSARLSAVITLGLSIVAATEWASGPEAACIHSTALRHFESYFLCPDSGWRGAFSWQIDDPLGANTGPVDILCEAQDPATSCLGNSGVAGDGLATIDTDWTFPDMVGCPLTPSPRSRVAVAATAGAPRYGLSILVSLARDSGDSYTLEMAHPWLEDEQASLALACDLSVQVVDVDVGRIQLRFAPPAIHTDCDRGTLGVATGVCTEAYAPILATGPVYMRVQPCDAPVDLRRELWTPTGVVPDVAGLAEVFVGTPGPGECRLLGATTILDDVEGSGITAFVADADCANRDGDQSYTCARDCDALTCKADCDDTNPEIYPGNTDPCNGIDDNCDGRIDENPDTDGDGFGDCVDNCPRIPNPGQEDGDLDGVGDFCDNCRSVANPNQEGADADAIGDLCDNCPTAPNSGQEDLDLDGVGNACDNCPTVPNPSQDGCLCDIGDCGRFNVIISFDSPFGKGSGVVSWRTSFEIDIVGFNVVRIDTRGRRIQLNDTLIRPQAGPPPNNGAEYNFIIPKHKNGEGIFVEMLRLNGTTQVSGPAERVR